MKRTKIFIQKQIKKLIHNRLVQLIKNNYARVPLFKKEITAFIDVNTSYPLVDQKIKEFISQYVKTAENPNNAEVTIVVGTKSAQFQRRWQFTGSPILKNPYYYYYGVQYNYKSLSQRGLPYVGIAGGYKDLWDGKNYILAFGNDIDGDIAAVKKLISARALFFDRDNLAEERTKLIDDLDRTGIAVADLLRDESNFVYYNQRRSAGFANVVDRILNNNNFEIAIKTVKTTNDNTTLRMKNINSDFSQNFADAIVGNSKPVVLARGLWSNLLTWQDFGKELAFDEENARDTWLIEITGGPEQDEKANAPNYEYEDLVDYYWPALITGVQNYSGQKVLDYISHSNGCRIALSSLSNYSRTGKNNSGYVFDTVTGNYIISNLGSNPVSTFVGVGCPGAFVGQSFFKKFFGSHGAAITASLSNKNHITQRDVAEKLINECSKEILGDDLKQCQYIAGKLSESDDGSKISRNLANDYLSFINDNNDTQPVYNNLSLTKGYFVYASLTKLADIKIPGTLVDFDQDGVVTSNDSIQMASLLITNNSDKTKQYSDISHSDLPNEKSVKKFIRGVLK